MAVLSLNPKQQQAMDALLSEKYNFILYGGAIRGGKSYFGIMALLLLCAAFPRSRWCIIRKDMEKIRTTTVPTFLKINPSGELKQSPYEYTHPNGSVILFKGENYAADKELDWMRGLEVNGFLFEEIHECRKKTLDKAFERSGSWVIPDAEHQPNPIILATCNPTFNWVKTLVYDRWKNNELPSKWLYIPAKITDNVDSEGNSLLPAAYLESLNNMPKFEYMVFVEGNWDIQIKTGGEFYKNFEVNKHVGFADYDPNLALHVSFDDNINPYLPAGVFQIKDNHIMMIAEFAGITPRNTVKDVCSDIEQTYRGHKSGMFIYGDATANKADTKLERGHNFYTLVMRYLASFKPVSRVMNSNPSVVMRGQWINYNLESDAIKVTISETCLKAISDFVSLKEAPDGTKLKEMERDEKTGARYQKVGHFSDLFDYLICSAFEKYYKEFAGKGRSGIRYGGSMYTKLPSA